jgi:hypothetical protein
MDENGDRMHLLAHGVDGDGDDVDGYHEPNLCRSRGIWMRGFLCLLLNSKRILTPT